MFWREQPFVEQHGPRAQGFFGIEIVSLLRIFHRMDQQMWDLTEDLIFDGRSTFWDRKCEGDAIWCTTDVFQEYLLNCLPGCFAFYPFPRNESLATWNIGIWDMFWGHLAFVLWGNGWRPYNCGFDHVKVGYGAGINFLKLVLSKQFGSSNACAGLLELFVHLHSGIVFCLCTGRIGLTQMMLEEEVPWINTHQKHLEGTGTRFLWFLFLGDGQRCTIWSVGMSATQYEAVFTSLWKVCDCDYRLDFMQSDGLVYCWPVESSRGFCWSLLPGQRNCSNLKHITMAVKAANPQF